MDSCLPTLLSDAQGSLTSVWIVPEDRSSSAKVGLRYHATQFGSLSQDSEVSGAGVEKCSRREWLMCSFVPTLLSDAQGSRISVWIVPEHGSYSFQVWLRHHVIQLGYEEVSGSGVCSCRVWLMGSCLPTCLSDAQGSLMSVRIVSDGQTSSA
jgi:hypothetical protein